MKKEILQAIKQECLSSFISSNYNMVTRENLKTIIVNLDYMLYTLCSRLTTEETTRVRDILVKYLQEDLED